ncbi:ribosomal-protein-alanine acetyltransferase [Lamprobacter modestohalophilus]|uniref:Ribosomal-protein-alanine acetyltransferase n=1 Tax=Lamprobacter modestohalophilus TaxID=1064514 RepID=A0A9X0W5N5_9GAMM|nr:peptidase C39 family protein [Lamprobacter modestohalophilus]MBK1617272.1 ribosomal-protein-alanine acetyltransferase [Lamprobacter modestohalophilus]
MRIRSAAVADIDALLELELASFASDRLSRRQFRYMLTRAHAQTLVAEDDQRLLGYVLVLFSRATSVARLYSIAVAEQARGQGVGRALVVAAEQAAWAEERAFMRLEIRRDNTASQALFEVAGYRRFGVLSDYYADHEEALRYEKRLSPDRKPLLKRVPFYAQTLDFTCGPSSLMMAMQALRPEIELTRTLELRIWRESTTIFMTSGHGGCGPLGLALAAERRGFSVEVFVNDPGVPLIDSVRSPEKKEVMRLVHEDMCAESERRGIPVQQGTLGIEDLQARWDRGVVPLVLISSYRIYREKFPHWVVVTGFDAHFVYCHDPYVDLDNGETTLDSIDMPIRREDFSRMARYGRVGLQAVVLISASQDQPQANDPALGGPRAHGSVGEQEARISAQDNNAHG